MGGPDSKHPLGLVYYWNTIEGCEYAANLLFREIEKLHGAHEARRILMKFAPSQSQVIDLRDRRLLERFDRMKPKPVVRQLARELAEENKSLPHDQQRGAGSTNVMVLDQHIRRLRRARSKRNRKK